MFALVEYGLYCSRINLRREFRTNRHKSLPKILEGEALEKKLSIGFLT